MKKSQINFLRPSTYGWSLEHIDKPKETRFFMNVRFNILESTGNGLSAQNYRKNKESCLWLGTSERKRIMETDQVHSVSVTCNHET